ncbi:MAG TPA: efflux RND transporter periplasmic adaptor subunit [Desulfomonilia bacterium]|nr:efflux RND transporter periplasmic adaptor subunit [Desulfomonilia bacterium]
MTKRMVIMLAALVVLFGGIFGYKAFMGMMMKKYMSAGGMPPVTVTAVKAASQVWKPQVKAVATLRAVRGVDVTSEIDGLVRTINFTSGDEVKAGQLLVQLNADADIAQLHAFEAAAELARSVYERDRKQFEVQAISRAALDADTADLKAKQAQVAQQAALVAKKSISAPFAGKLGINLVNPGQFVKAGDKVVTLQSLDSIYVDFYLPQQELSRISLGRAVIATTDTYPHKTFSGKITAINPKVDAQTRNFQVEATVKNPAHELLPGMYALADVQAGNEEKLLTLPKTAVTFNPYGETVYLVEEKGKGPKGKPVLIAKQTFITIGLSRGDQVSVLTGVREGDLVVTSGQLKLKNGSTVIINNRVQPLNDAAPKPVDE